ncbi:MAG: hypothetical protein ACYC4A_05825 [Desulfobulbia bacterium]
MTKDLLSSSATCEAPLPYGRLLAVHVSAASMAGETLAPIKVEGSPYRQRLLDALHAARMVEPVHDPNWRVRCKHGVNVAGDEAGVLEFAAIVADRLARRRFRATTPRVIALGASSDWLAGRVEPLPLALHRACLETMVDTADLGEVEILLPAPPDDACVVLHEALQTCHPQAIIRIVETLDSLDGHPFSGGRQRRARVWFPTIGASEADDRLLDVDVVVRPFNSMDQGEAGDPIRVAGLAELDNPARQHLIALIREMRHLDHHGSGKWDTHIRFARGFQGGSCELPLVLADRIARGREFPGRGRLIATGAVNSSVSGHHVRSVENCTRKCRLILAHIAEGDRVLLPAEWRDGLPPGFMRSVEQAGATCALIERVF